MENTISSLTLVILYHFVNRLGFNEKYMIILAGISNSLHLVILGISRSQRFILYCIFPIFIVIPLSATYDFPIVLVNSRISKLFLGNERS